MSFDRALRGETYTTCVSSANSPHLAVRTRRSRHRRNAASVFPDPVGAEIRTSRPRAISGQPRICGSVAPSNRAENHSLTRGSKIVKDIEQAKRLLYYHVTHLSRVRHLVGASGMSAVTHQFDSFARIMTIRTAI